MKKKIEIIILCLAFLIIGYLIYLDKTDNSKTKLETQIEQLQSKNDSLRWSNNLLDSLIITQRGIADSLNKELANTNATINKLNNVRYERIRAIDSMGSNKLHDFFSEFGSPGTDN